MWKNRPFLCYRIQFISVAVLTPLYIFFWKKASVSKRTNLPSVGLRKEKAWVNPPSPSNGFLVPRESQKGGTSFKLLNQKSVCFSPGQQLFCSQGTNPNHLKVWFSHSWVYVYSSLKRFRRGSFSYPLWGRREITRMQAIRWRSW